jgi:hypothetical protein
MLALAHLSVLPSLLLLLLLLLLGSGAPLGH